MAHRSGGSFSKGVAVSATARPAFRQSSLIRGTVSDALQLRIRQRSPEGTTDHTVGPVVLSQRARDRMVEAGPTDETLLWVARIYIMAELVGDPPAKHVREAFKVPTSTAGYWIRRAKDRKILNG